MGKKFEIIYVVILLVFTLYVILDTFVIRRSIKKADTSSTESIKVDESTIKTTDTTYEDENMTISLKEYTENSTKIYVADVVFKNGQIKTAFASNSYGKNITDKTSNIAESVNAILAINGDYYGVQESGYVLKNGKIYRSESAGDKEDLVIYKDGTFEIINESDVSLNSLLEKGAVNVLSFGPALITDGEISVSSSDEVGKAMRSNPRTAIGIIDKNHYVFVVSDGRTTESKGLSLLELATFMDAFGCKVAYNLDGGGSSTMYFNGKVVNNPTTNGNKISERSVSDIVYVGY